MSFKTFYKKEVLKEKLSAIVYHDTTYDGLVGILKKKIS